jgi:ubiquinone/menaquinone biosynthesis C-methylase UbiE
MEEFEKTTINSYDQTVDEYIKNVDDLHPVKESKKFLSYLGKNKSILDIGCGPGRDAKIFANKGFEAVGIDLSKKMIEAAISRVKNAKFKIMDIRKLEFEDNNFDGAWASASFLHIPKKDILKGLQEVHRVLKDKGIFYISVKQGKGEILKPDERYNDTQKFWSFFQKDEIENELVKAGFEIIESYVEEQNSSYATNPWIQIFCRK